MLIHPDPDDPNCADIMVGAAICGRPYLLRLDTGAARTQLVADDYLAGLTTLGRDNWPARSASRRTGTSSPSAA